MDDSYISFWSIVWWIGAGVMLLGVLATLSPAGKSDPKRGQTAAGTAMLALLFTAFGFMAQGSRSQREADRALREADRNVAIARANLDAAERAEAAAPRGPGVHSVSRSMSFEACLATIRSTATDLGAAPENVVESSIARIVRFRTSDGSVLVTCSKPDNKLIITRSPGR